MISICSIDTEHSEPGTEVKLVWGEKNGQSSNPAVEPHTQTELSANVAPSPYLDDSR